MEPVPHHSFIGRLSHLIEHGAVLQRVPHLSVVVVVVEAAGPVPNHVYPHIVLCNHPFTIVAGCGYHKAVPGLTVLEMVTVDFNLNLIIWTFKINLFHEKLLERVLRHPIIKSTQLVVKSGPARFKQLVEIFQHIANHLFRLLQIILIQIPDHQVQIEVPL